MRLSGSNSDACTGAHELQIWPNQVILGWLVKWPNTLVLGSHVAHAIMRIPPGFLGSNPRLVILFYSSEEFRELRVYESGQVAFRFASAQDKERESPHIDAQCAAQSRH